MVESVSTLTDWQMNFRSRWLALAAGMLGLLLFALQPLAYMRNPPEGSGLMAPLMATVAIALGLVFAQVFPRRGLVAALCAGVSTSLFAYGENYVDAALDSLFGGPFGWWGEKFLVQGVVICIPAILVAAAVGFFVSRSFKQEL
ncbi:MAG: hypothetical protein QM608_00960 [Caulobacter sp.]